MVVLEIKSFRIWYCHEPFASLRIEFCCCSDIFNSHFLNFIFAFKRAEIKTRICKFCKGLFAGFPISFPPRSSDRLWLVFSFSLKWFLHRGSFHSFAGVGKLSLHCFLSFFALLASFQQVHSHWYSALFILSEFSLVYPVVTALIFIFSFQRAFRLFPVPRFL